MSKRQAITTWAIVVSGIFVLVVTITILARRHPVTLRGAVLRQDKDPNKQLPIADVQITATNALGSGSTKSDPSGFFSLTLPKGLRRRQRSSSISGIRIINRSIGMTGS